MSEQITGAACQVPTYHVCVDCESQVDDSDHRVQYLWFWVAHLSRWDGERLKRIASASGGQGPDFWEWVWSHTPRRSVPWVWTHNAAVDLTWLGLWEQLDGGKISLEWGVFDSVPFVARVERAGRKLILIDSLNFYRCRLEELGGSVGLEKLCAPGPDADLEAWGVYCERDVEILDRAVDRLCQWVASTGQKRLCWTIGAQAWQSYQDRGPRIRPRPHGIRVVSAFEREAYYGPICEPFYLGTVGEKPERAQPVQAHRSEPTPHLGGVKVHVYDFKSFYPSILQSQLFPVNYERSVRGMTASHFQRLAPNCGAIALARIASADRPYPRREGGVTHWRTGTYDTVLAQPELESAWQRGELVAIHYAQIYELKPCFQEWAEWVREERKKASSADSVADERFWKQLANSLHGYYGRHTHRWERWRRGDGASRWGTGVVQLNEGGPLFTARWLGGACELNLPAGEHPQAVVAVPVFVNSYARALMRDVIDRLPPRALLYCDTDSFHVTDAGREALDSEIRNWIPAWADLAYQGCFNSAEYISAKCYVLGGRASLAGTPRKHVQVGERTYSHEVWPSMGVQAARAPTSNVFVGKKTSHLLRGHAKKDWDEDGWGHYRAHVFSEETDWFGRL